MTAVANLYKVGKKLGTDPSFVYIGRKGRGFDGYFGNPYPLQKEEERGATLGRYRAYLEDRIEKDPEFRQRVAELSGKTLVCFCHPKPCHGDILAEVADRLAGSANVRRKP